MENYHLETGCFEDLTSAIDALCSVAELAGNDNWFVGGGRLWSRYHPTYRTCCASEQWPRNAVEPGDVHDTRKHHDVFDSDVGRGIATGQGRNHKFWKTDGQRAHGGRADGRPATATQRDDSVNAPRCS